MVNSTQTHRRPRGYSVIELLFGLGLMSVIGSMAMMQMGTAAPSMKGDGAMRVIVAQLNTARELSISQRRQMQVQFNAPNNVTITRLEVPVGTTVISRVFIEGGLQFGLVSGVPDTPDGFGNSSGVDFGGAASVMFNSDGTMIDQTGNPRSGTVFLRIPNLALSYRAVTILGGTGRIRGYKWNSRLWVRM